MNICVLIPAHNEASAIGSVVEALKVKGLDVIVVDDGSVDLTAVTAEAKGALVLSNEKRSGKGKSLQNGFKYVLNSGYHGVIAMDGDGQHAVEDIDAFLDCARQHPVSIITGNRMTNTKGMPLIRKMTNRFMSGLISFACRQSIPDTQCGYRYINTEILRKMNLSSGDFEIETEMLMKAAKKGFKIYSIPIKTIYENELSKIHPVKDTIRFFVYFIREIFSRDK